MPLYPVLLINLGTEPKLNSAHCPTEKLVLPQRWLPSPSLYALLTCVAKWQTATRPHAGHSGTPCLRESPAATLSWLWESSFSGCFPLGVAQELCGLDRRIMNPWRWSPYARKSQALQVSRKIMGLAGGAPVRESKWVLDLTDFSKQRIQPNPFFLSASLPAGR